MKNLFLTSDMKMCTKVDGVLYSQPIYNENGIVDRIKEKLKKEDLMIMVASNPDNYQKTDAYKKVMYESFNKSGFNFKEQILIDHRYTGNLEEDIARSDLILLSGGDTPNEIKYFEEINLRELLKNYEGVIIGISAGSINSANLVVYSPVASEIGTDINVTWRGLGLTNINIEPHFITGELNENKKLEREVLLKLSEEYKIYAIVDGTDIYDDGVMQTMYGEGYLIENKNIKKICDNKKNIKL